MCKVGVELGSRGYDDLIGVSLTVDTWSERPSIETVLRVREVKPVLCISKELSHPLYANEGSYFTNKILTKGKKEKINDHPSPLL